MAKQISGYVKLQIRGGQANPAPPVGPALGAKGVNIVDFCKQFNARTQDRPGKVLPVVITVYQDKSFDFIIKTPPVASQLLPEELQYFRGEKEIAEIKMSDLNAFKVESAMRMVAGTARSMGINVTGQFPEDN